LAAVLPAEPFIGDAQSLRRRGDEVCEGIESAVEVRDGGGESISQGSPQSKTPGLARFALPDWAEFGVRMMSEREVGRDE
jgi:hypothetical protein